jgi:hypothetical protein
MDTPRADRMAKATLRFIELPVVRQLLYVDHAVSHSRGSVFTTGTVVAHTGTYQYGANIGPIGRFGYRNVAIGVNDCILFLIINNLNVAPMTRSYLHLAYTGTAVVQSALQWCFFGIT